MTYSITHSHTHSPTHSLIYSLTSLIIHTLFTPSHTHTLTLTRDSTGAGLVATHSNCSIYTEATNAYKLGYTYVVLLADYQSSPNDYRLDTHAHAHTNTTHNLEETLLHHSLTEVEEEELRKLDIFVAIVSTNDYNRALYLSSRYQNSISQPLRSEGTSY